jgi:hypothetical protein
MKTGLFGAMLLWGAMFATALWAQTQSPLSRPAETPPATYAEPQYIDSKGCAFRRATIDGRVTWAARVTAHRQQVCGLPPSVSPEDLAVDATIGSDVPGQAGATPSTPFHAAHGQRRISRTATVLLRYRPVWKDDRLNPLRGATNPVPVAAGPDVAPPHGYIPVWQDGRLNPKRGPRPVQKVQKRAKPRAPTADLGAVHTGAARVKRISTRSGSPSKMPRADR